MPSPLSIDDRHQHVVHVSQQNTFAGKLTEAMFDEVIRNALLLAGG